ncbi:hypothetical protein PRIPAC_74894 [Pristionchus pacificus]|uniref:Membrane transporter n=1 Tax=Pristionchus pacificus TaxID=54126 RepID=A0A2A6CZ82_PRIPA|nr:hypothetical protein PRIPAC_74894 [Pristionchus pacificus]|eukprot:PDM83534.1 membrane transporter [Pristionchus pacificus]
MLLKKFFSKMDSLSGKLFYCSEIMSTAYCYVNVYRTVSSLDYLKKRGKIGHTAAAMFAQTLGSAGSSSFLLLVLFFADCRHPELAEYSHKYELVFGICITLNVIAGLIYIGWGTAEVQPWTAHVKSVPGDEKTNKLLDEGNHGEEMKLFPTPSVDSRAMESNEKKSNGKSPLLTSMRFRICLLLLAAFTVSTSMRSHFSMTLVCMLKKTSSNTTASSINTKLVDNGCPNYYIGSDGVEIEAGEIEWSREFTPYLFAIVQLGQVFSLIISMYFSNRIDPSKMLLFAIFSEVLVSFISPTLARISYWAFFVSRFFIGMGEGLISSPCGTIATRWFPPNERASMAAVYTSANQISNGIAPFIVSHLCSLQLGWSAAFYIFGLLGLLWVVAWFAFGSDDPSHSKRISKKERENLSQLIPAQKHVVARPLYGKMFTSPIFFAHIAAVMAFYSTTGIMASFLPTFFEERMGLPIRTNGLLDSLKKRGKIGHTAAAKLAQTLGSTGSSSFLLLVLFFADCRHPELAVLAMTLCLAFHSCMAVGFYASMIQICPPITGVIVPIVIASGVIASTLSNTVMGVAAEYSHKYELVFGICITLNIAAGLIYIVWGTAEVQPWAAHVETYSGDEKTKKLLDGENQGDEMKIIPIPSTDRTNAKD